MPKERHTSKIGAPQALDCGGEGPPQTPLFMPMPTLAEVRAELRGEIKMYMESYCEADGKVHRKDALWTIACLKRAIEESMPRKKGPR